MSERGADSPGTGPIDTGLLDRIAARLDGSRRFTTVTSRPPEAPNSVVANLDTGHYPSSVEQVTLHIRWFETDDFSIHYGKFKAKASPFRAGMKPTNSIQPPTMV